MKIILILAGFLVEFVHGKIYSRCELARELKYVHNAPDHQLATWVCIAEHESQYNTSIVGYLSGDGSGDHGIFQISDQFWCSPPGKGYACGLTCAELEDDNITDDFQCAQTIYKEHKQLSGDGFNAWAVYKPHCKGPKAIRYIKDCFNDSEEPKTFTTSNDFAHGFFDTAAGRTNKGFLPFQKVSFQSVFSLKSPAIVQNQFSFTTQKTASKPSFLLNERFFTPTEVPNFDLFFTPTTVPTFKPTVITTSTFKPSTIRRQNEKMFNPSTTIVPAVSRSSIFNFNTPSRVFTPSSHVFQTSSVTHPAPVFIINGAESSRAPDFKQPP